MLQTDDGMLQLDAQTALGVTRSFGAMLFTHVSIAFCWFHFFGL